MFIKSYYKFHEYSPCLLKVIINSMNIPQCLLKVIILEDFNAILISLQYFSQMNFILFLVKMDT